MLPAYYTPISENQTQQVKAAQLAKQYAIARDEDEQDQHVKGNRLVGASYRVVQGTMVDGAELQEQHVLMKLQLQPQREVQFEADALQLQEWIAQVKEATKQFEKYTK
jgi:hypothetical protein